MRIALMIEGQEDVTWNQWRALAGACEQHGIEAMFRSDHYMSVEGKDGRASLDAWATIAALGPVTSSLRLGTMVSPATFRHPSELAKVVTTADHASGGRVELGMGTGWLDAEHEAYGFPFPSMRERMERLEEQIAIVAGEWADGRFTFDGNYFKVDVDALPKPVQRPRPNLIVGGQGGKRSVAMAARHADEYNTVYKTIDELEGIRARLDDACSSAGRDRMPLSLMTGWIVGADESEFRDRATQLAEWRGHEGDVDSFLESLPEAWIMGTAEHAEARLEQLAQAGVERVMAQHLLHRDLDAITLLGRLA
jgi:F420-dependent oxidoreductase-like protein